MSVIRELAGLSVSLSKDIPDGVVHVNCEDGTVVTFYLDDEQNVVGEVHTHPDGTSEVVQ